MLAKVGDARLDDLLSMLEEMDEEEAVKSLDSGVDG